MDECRTRRNVKSVAYIFDKFVTEIETPTISGAIIWRLDTPDNSAAYTTRVNEREK